MMSSNTAPETVHFASEGHAVAGALFLPSTKAPAPSLIVCHGAGEFKENYFQLGEFLAAQGVAVLVIDLYGHGASGGERFHVVMSHWVANIRSAIDFLEKRPELDPNRIAAFGLSSGGTAVLEAALVEPRLKALVTLDPTVRNTQPLPMICLLHLLLLAGRMKLRLTGKTLRLPLAKVYIGPKLASDPVINQQILDNPRSWDAFMAYPLPGGEEAFFVDTIQRVGRITIPTLVIWGADDRMDPPETGRLLSAALTCKKQLHIIPGNGHVGHLDRNRVQVFKLAAEWVLENTLVRGGAEDRVATLAARPVAASPREGLCGSRSSDVQTVRVIEGEEARMLGRQEKWELLSPFLRRHGREPLAYATLQQGMEYFVTPSGYIAYVRAQHPVFSPRPRRIVLSDPVCAREDLKELIERFMARDRLAVFGVISEQCADVLRPMGFKVNCIGYEPELPLQTYNTQGNWKELDLIKRARNEAKREGIVIREESGATLNREGMNSLSARWIATKKINDREIWIYARRPILDHEEDVRKFVAYDRAGQVAGFAFYDPMYRNGHVFGYAANIVRCDERRYGRLGTAMHMAAADQFKAEGKESLNLMLAPFVKLEQGKYNDDKAALFFFKLSARFGDNIYNIKGLSFHKSKYRGAERSLYMATNSRWMSNDIYLAYRSADIARSYFATLGQLARGLLPSWKSRQRQSEPQTR